MQAINHAKTETPLLLSPKPELLKQEKETKHRNKPKNRKLLP